MINKFEASIEGLCIHQVGRKSEDEGITLSNEVIFPKNEPLEELLLRYFLDNFKEPEYYQFTFASDEIELNPVYNFVSNIFDDPKALLEQSVKITRQLYERSSHPNIKSGDVVVALIKNVLIDDELLDAVAIFKSETKDTFLKLSMDGQNYHIDFEDGINIEKLDKACLIFNTNRDTGYKIAVIDKLNRNKDAIYWKEDFLNVTPRNDAYHTTTQYISLTKSYVRERLQHEDTATKIDEADIMHRSKEYLQNVETFDREEFENSVFRNEQLKTSFKDYAEDYQSEKNIKLPETFEISTQAVRKRSKTFRSVIKLDKNFHIYVHGDRSKIERIEEIDGRKYYKLFFDQES